MVLTATSIRTLASFLSNLGVALSILLIGQAAISPLANARGLTMKPDEKRVTRVVRLTPDTLSYNEPNFCLLSAFNQTNDKVLLWGPVRGAAWARVDALTSWKTPEEFNAAVKDVPQWGSRWHQPIWSELPGEADVVYELNLDSGEVIRVDLQSGKNAVVVQLPGNPTFAKNFFLPGFSTDGKLIVWEAPDDPNTRGWEVDVTGRTARVLTSEPAEWSPEWSRLPFKSHGHSARSPGRTMVIGSAAPDGHGYTSYLMKKGEHSVGLANEPALNHVNWRSSDHWAVFDEVSTGSLYQLWTDGTWLKLLDLRLSKVSLNMGGYYRISSFPNVSRDGRMLLYSSDGGDPKRNIGIFLAFLEDANAGAPVGIERFEANPPEVLAGSNGSRLMWSTQNATSVRISPAPGSVEATGSLVVNPGADAEYELLADGPQGPMTAHATVSVHQQVPESLIPNGSMEIGGPGAIPSGWNAPAAAAITRDESHDFSSSVRVASDPTTRSQGKIWAFASEENARRAQGHRVKLTAWVKSAVPRGVRGDSLQISYGSPLQRLVTPISDVIGREWKKLETAFVLPENIDGKLQAVIAAVPGWEDAAVYLDQVSLEIDDAPKPPVIESFVANSYGSTMSIAWRARGATSLVLMPQNITLSPLDAGVFVFGGDYRVPTEGVLRLVAQGPGGATSGEVLLHGSTSAAGPPQLPIPGAPELTR